MEDLYDERLYRALDRLLPHKEALEKHLVKRLGELFDLDYDLLLYDVTSTYFEGVADPEIAKRGYSRDHRPDCVQMTMNRRVWAFKRGGALGPAPAPAAPPLVLPWSGRVDETGAIQLGTVTAFNVQSAGRREEWKNAYGVSPSRTRVAPGSPLTFTNTTTMTHTITARDGSWTSGPIAPGATASVTMTRAGVYEYRCIEHPWSMGELTVAATQTGGGQ